MSVLSDATGGRGAVLSAATTTTLGAVTLPFTGTNHPISIVGFAALALGSIALVAHVTLRIVNRFISR